MRGWERNSWGFSGDNVKATFLTTSKTGQTSLELTKEENSKGLADPSRRKKRGLIN